MRKSTDFFKKKIMVFFYFYFLSDRFLLLLAINLDLNIGHFYGNRGPTGKNDESFSAIQKKFFPS